MTKSRRHTGFTHQSQSPKPKPARQDKWCYTYPPPLAESSIPVLQALSLSTLFNISLNPDLKQSLAGMETICNLNAIVLSPASPESGRIACFLICSLAMLDKNKAKFGVAGTIKVLVKAVERPHGPGSHHILSSLAELVQFQGKCSLAVRCGVVEALLGIVEAKDGEDLAGTSLAVLGLLARFDEALNALVRKKYIVNTMVDVLRGMCMLSKEGAAEI